MMETIKETNRRNFLKTCGLSTVPLLLPGMELHASALSATPAAKEKPLLNFVFDGLALSPAQYIDQLQQINESARIMGDSYGYGGATAELEQKFARLTGKEKAIYLPTGTMANQLAIKLLSGNATKVIVPENSHVYRDEADAAQSVHNKRLIPVGRGKAFFDVEGLKQTLEYIDRGEVFKSGLRTVVIESPVRRADGTAIPIETIQAIASYCTSNGYNLHLDGARIHLASAFAGISLKDYASHFDTVYISLYKYLNAAGGAILCGSADLIDQVTHQIKIYGGTVYQTWTNTAMASHYLDRIDDQLKNVVGTANQLMEALNTLEGISVTGIPMGTNIFNMQLDASVDGGRLGSYLREEHRIFIRRASTDGLIKIAFNESLLSRDWEDTLEAWKKGLEVAKA